MLASFKGPSILQVLLGDMANSVGERATTKLFSYGSRLSCAEDI